MRSRPGILETAMLVLGLAAVPFWLAVATGCHLVFGLQGVEPVDENFLWCGCECHPSTPDPVSSLRIQANEDDAEQIGATMNLTNNPLRLGQNVVGLRFTELMIPQGAVILSAQVRFTAANNDSGDADFSVSIENSISPALFTTADNDLTDRSFSQPVPWPVVPAWESGDSIAAQETPDLKDLLQPLVSDPDWSNESGIVLLVEGTGTRRARSRDSTSSRQALLEVRYFTGVRASLPTCAVADIERDSNGKITDAGAIAHCGVVEQTLEGLAGPCGYPMECTCAPDIGRGRRDLAACRGGCDEEQLVLENGSCGNFDPNAFQSCVETTGNIGDCKALVSATNAPGDTPICVASGSPLAFHAFGSRSECALEGISEIRIDGNEPKKDPLTVGTLEFLGRPCPGGGCSQHPFFDLEMEPISFEVRFARDPVFRDLGAAGRGLEVGLLDANGEIYFPENTITGTGSGRRTERGVAIEARNAAPLTMAIDWHQRTCSMEGLLGVGLGDDGVCSGDPNVACLFESDCDQVGGPCILPDDPDQMEVELALAGELVNQPPTADAGGDQEVECTSSQGATVELDGHGSSDPDGNLALASWRAGNRVGPLVASGLFTEQALGVGASQFYVLRVIDTFAQTHEDGALVSVVDTTPPEIECNAPQTITPPDAALAFAATATDVCDDEVDAIVTGYDCYAFTQKGKRVSKLASCRMSFAGDTLTIRDVGGYGNHIEWTVEATDDSGNVGHRTCLVVVEK